MPKYVPKLRMLPYNNTMARRKNPAVDYRKLNAELDELIVKLQSGELDIDEAIACYERGSEIIAELQTYLKTAENKISKVLKST